MIRLHFLPLLVLFVISACDAGEGADVDDEEQRDQIEAATADLVDGVEERRQDSAKYLDEARRQVEAAIEEAGQISEDAFDFDE